MKIKKQMTLLLIFSFINTSIASEVNDFVLPNNIDNFQKKSGAESGAIYLSPTKDNKALMPINFWGEIKRSGLHYIPTDTNIIKGLSLAGGPVGQANIEEISVSRTLPNNEQQIFKLNLQEISAETNNFALKPGDTVYVSKNNFMENRSYYTSLIGVVATILSSFILYREIKK